MLQKLLVILSKLSKLDVVDMMRFSKVIAESDSSILVNAKAPEEHRVTINKI